MYRITFLAPYPECIPLIEQVFRERPDRDQIRYEILPDYYNNPLEQVKGDVLISRGFTARTMKKLNLPGAELTASGYDVVRAVDQCVKRYPGTRIAIVGARNLIYGSEMVSLLYEERDIHTYPVLYETQLEQAILQAVREGAQTIVGGCSTCDIARQHGIPCVLIESGRESIDAAISNAINIVDVSRYEKEKRKTLDNLINYSFQGILLVDLQGVIEVTNLYCLEHLNQGKGPLKGRNIREFFPELDYEELVRQDRKVLSEIYRCGGKSFLMNCVPVVVGQKVTSCVITLQTIEKIIEEESTIRKRIHKKGFWAKYNFSDIIHLDEAVENTIRNAREFSAVDSNILIRGETGTGKELFAQSIHNASRRKNNPFVAINCAALPDNILESELFGYEEGAFTGASKGGKTGFFEIAHKGTLFLDEIGDISPKLQSRLLRVLQEREIIRLGSDTVIPIDVRIIAATNKDLYAEVKKGAFREDLYYRLDVLELKLPPIRQRRADILCLIEHFLSLEHEKHTCALRGFTPRGKAMLKAYDWPGNIREIRNFCERISILCKNELADTTDILNALPNLSLEEAAGGSPAPDTEREQLQRLLLQYGGSRKETARALGVHPSTLWRRMKKLGLD
ncbi:sigma-54-dependent Fis family transcriptional regulator [Gemmiger sp. An87]|nr:sigma-54-dependent Fis family transcriptional regulator [Gemmiger sp. An87]